MSVLSKKLCGTLVSILICSIAYAADPPAINITFLSKPQDIAHILQLQKKMVMSKQPKELSTHPKAICFAADIKHFLPSDTQPLPVYGCVFSDQISMNAALLRAGLYVHTDVGMADDAQLYNSKLMSAVGGHDFSGKQLAEFCKNANIPGSSLPEHKTFKAIEREFHQQVIKPIIESHQGDFIFFSVINTKKFKENLSHELLHAQYYNTPQIATIVRQVWHEVSKPDQELIIDCLQKGGYDMNQHDLLLREFYSYFLQYNATKYLEGIPVLKPMAPLAAKYAKKIRAALEKHHIKVLKV